MGEWTAFAIVVGSYGVGFIVGWIIATARPGR